VAEEDEVMLEASREAGQLDDMEARVDEHVAVASRQLVTSGGGA
jgi:hypothetical protein